MALLEIKHLQKTYTTRFGGNKVEALRGISFSVEKGEFVAVMGESGSGKTTLLNLLASLDKPTFGDIELNGTPMSSIRERDLSSFRRQHLGFIFQDFNLLDTLSAEDNIYLPLVLAGQPYQEMQPRLTPLAKLLGIGDILKKFPYEISGGQKQRVAAARALITNPDLLLADEPTGALDSKASGALLRLMAEVNQKGQTIVMVTHSARAASAAGRVLFIRDGELFHQIYRGQSTTEEFHRKIADVLSLGTAPVIEEVAAHA